MRREPLAPRAGWQSDMESIGFYYHSIDGTYWDESRCYVFESSEIDQLEDVTGELHQMALNAAQHVIASQRYEEFAIPREWVPAIERSWHAIATISPLGSRSLDGWTCRTTVSPRPSCSNTTPIRRRRAWKRVSRSGNGCRPCDRMRISSI